MNLKRIVVSVIVLSIILGGCQNGRYDGEKTKGNIGDAGYINPEHQEILNAMYEEMGITYTHLIRLHTAESYSWFGEGTLVEHLNQEKKYISYLPVSNENGAYRTHNARTLENGRQYGIQPYVPYHSWDTLIPYVLDPSLIFGDNIQVYAVYCLQDKAPGSVGSTIYYVTDQGDYCLNMNGDNYPIEEAGPVYLVPYETLQEMIKEEKEKNRPASGQGGASVGASYAMADLDGSEQYIIDLENPPEFPLK